MPNELLLRSGLFLLYVLVPYCHIIHNVDYRYATADFRLQRLLNTEPCHIYVRPYNSYSQGSGPHSTARKFSCENFSLSKYLNFICSKAGFKGND